jgi:hypothetical protein
MHATEEAAEKGDGTGSDARSIQDVRTGGSPLRHSSNERTIAEVNETNAVVVGCVVLRHKYALTGGIHAHRADIPEGRGQRIGVVDGVITAVAGHQLHTTVGTAHAEDAAGSTEPHPSTVIDCPRPHSLKTVIGFAVLLSAGGHF